MDENRQNPDELLKAIRKEEQNQSRGHLKIFFGYAAGVGKTYAMLKYVEPHARPKTAALLNGLEILPTLDIEYSGITLHEFDLDAAIARKPQLLLVDELAHTNAEGCRHAKRYQDIEAVLPELIDFLDAKRQIS